ncbi:beta-lactamase-like protein [Rhodocollybia butyracea]|uniref:Beta-lactamase-like protein n=1 Tax=Rhodocollybia butyracea TaxID=206335 RepID=A0A9P5TZD7_9AGAR|nr:beta-lactamase-like protein [Rhodocollybia butyracea]
MAFSCTITVSALIPGHFYLPHEDVFQDAFESKASSGDIVPTFAFLLEHPSHGKYMFDLGLRKHGKGYPPAWDETLEEFKPDCSQDVCDILRANRVEPTEIKGVIFSHLHFDHTGDIEPFTSAEIILGIDAKPLFDSPYPEDPESLFPDWPKGRIVRYLEYSDDTETETYQTQVTTESPTESLVMSSSSHPLPRFTKAFDFFGDQSLLIIDAPGHFPGHLMALARVSERPPTNRTSTSGTSIYVLLAGDCCHNRECYSPGTRLISQANYEDVAVARETVASLIRTVKEMPNVVVVLAHEKELENEGMPLLPDSLNEWAVKQVAERISERGHN